MKREWNWMLDKISNNEAKMFLHWVKKTHPRMFNDLWRAYKEGDR